MCGRGVESLIREDFEGGVVREGLNPGSIEHDEGLPGRREFSRKRASSREA